MRYNNVENQRFGLELNKGKRVGTAMGRKWNNIKEKKLLKMPIQAGFTPNLAVRFM